MAAKNKCCYCKELFPKGEMIKAPNGSKFCTLDHQVKNAFKNREKGRVIKHKQQKNDFKLNDTSHQHDLTQPVFNKLRRLQEFKWFSDRDLEPECISCGKKNMDWCCGHFKTRGSQSNLKYDFVNTYLQCNRYCNRALSGNIEGNKTTRGYKQGLLERFGEGKAKEIIDYCETNTQVKKWKGEELKVMRISFNKEIRKLEGL